MPVNVSFIPGRRITGPRRSRHPRVALGGSDFTQPRPIRPPAALWPPCCKRASVLFILFCAALGLLAAERREAEGKMVRAAGETLFLIGASQPAGRGAR